MAYVYRHIRHDKNIPFYIGIGSDKYFKRAKTKSRRNPIWYKIAGKTDFDVDILFDNLTIEAAKEKEKEFVALYGRIATGTGSLANISGGGDGMFDVPRELRDRYSVRFAGEGNPFYGKKHTAETRKYISEIQKGTIRGPRSQQTKDRISQKVKGRTPPLKGKKDPKGAAARTGVKHMTYQGEVNCYDKNKVFIRTFACNKDAAEYLGVRTNGIRRVILGKRRFIKGHIFKLKSDTTWQNSPDYNKPYLKNRVRKVIDTATGIIYNSITEAGKAINSHQKTLANKLHGLRPNDTTMKFYANPY